MNAVPENDRGVQRCSVRYALHLHLAPLERPVARDYDPELVLRFRLPPLGGTSTLSPCSGCIIPLFSTHQIIKSCFIFLAIDSAGASDARMLPDVSCILVLRRQAATARHHFQAGRLDLQGRRPRADGGMAAHCGSCEEVVP
jgi:hypothetical protein